MLLSLFRARSAHALTGMPLRLLAAARSPGARPWLAMLVAGLVVTLMLVILVRRLEEQSAQAAFTSAAEARLTLLDASLARTVDGLLAVGASLDGNPAMSRQQFAQIAQSLLARQPGVRALEWIPLVHPEDLSGLVAQAHAEGFPNFAVRELDEHQRLQALTPRTEHFPVWFVEPMAGNERAFGLDLASSPPRRAALMAARQRGAATVSTRITLVQDDSRLFAVLMFRPVYALHPPSGNSHSVNLAPVDPSALRGFALTVLRISEVLGEDPRGRDGERLQLYLFDEDGLPGEQRLHPVISPYPTAASLPPLFRVERQLEVGGRRWRAVAQVGAAGLHPDRTGSLVVLLAGLLISALLARLQFQSLHRTRAIREIVERRTTELRDSERRLIQLNQEAMQASRAKTVFLASMTHEFRTPMNAILGLLHVLGRSPLDEPQRDHVEKISGAARRLLRLIEDILDVSRIEAGKLSVERHPFQIETVLRDVLVATLPRLRDKTLELLLDLDPEVPAQLVGDGMRLTQVLVNLAENAAKFTQKGEVTVRIRRISQVDRRVDLEFAVSDTGPGLSASDAERLFTPFVQADSSHPRVFGGSGLGLSISRQLVGMMGGDIRVISAIGQGTTFQFTLPLGIASAAPLATPRPAQPAVRVLLLETHPQAAATLTRLLQGFGAQVQRAASPEQLPRPFQAADFDLVLISQGFPRAHTIQSALTGLPGVRVVELSAAGASLRGLQPRAGLEKPLLPGAVAALLYPALQTADSAPAPMDFAGATAPAAPASGAVLSPAALADLPEWMADDRSWHADDTGRTTPPDPLQALLTEDPADPAGQPIAADSALLPLVQELAVLLRAGDPDAETPARALRHLAGDGLHADVLDRVLSLVVQFDYEPALRLLEQLLPQALPDMPVTDEPTVKEP